MCDLTEETCARDIHNQSSMGIQEQQQFKHPEKTKATDKIQELCKMQNAGRLWNNAFRCLKKYYFQHVI